MSYTWTDTVSGELYRGKRDTADYYRRKYNKEQNKVKWLRELLKEHGVEVELKGNTGNTWKVIKKKGD